VEKKKEGGMDQFCGQRQKDKGNGFCITTYSESGTKTRNGGINPWEKGKGLLYDECDTSVNPHTKRRKGGGGRKESTPKLTQKVMLWSEERWKNKKKKSPNFGLGRRIN